MTEAQREWILIDFQHGRFYVMVRDPVSDHDDIPMYGVLNKFDDPEKAKLYAAGVLDGRQTMRTQEMYEGPTDPEKVLITRIALKEVNRRSDQQIACLANVEQNGVKA